MAVKLPRLAWKTFTRQNNNCQLTLLLQSKILSKLAQRSVAFSKTFGIKTGKNIKVAIKSKVFLDIGKKNVNML